MTFDQGAAGPVVTVDGPAGSGKSSTARAVARRLGFRHLDSGALYRALTWALLEGERSPDAWPDLTEADLEALEVGLSPTPEGFDVLCGDRVLGDELRAERVTSRVAQLAGLPAVRACLLELQRAAARAGGVVADGRDMGTVVFPDAALKIFLVADLEERARRRLAERGEPTGAEAIAREARAIEARDRRDSEREISPLERAPDARRIDTTGLSLEEQVDRVAALARELTPP